MVGTMIKVKSPRVEYGPQNICSNFNYESTNVIRKPNGEFEVTPFNVEVEVSTVAKVPKTGLMMVGLGGNNGTTFTGMVLANRLGLSWETRTGTRKANFFGSVSQVGTIPLGLDQNGRETFVPIKSLIPLWDPSTMELDGWDISSMNLGEGMKRAGVFEYDLQEKLRPHMSHIIPRKAAFFQDFVAANQADRVDNVLSGSKWAQLQQLRADIKDFKTSKGLEKVIVLWVGNTERFSEILIGLNDSWISLEKAIKANAHEISPSTLYAAAAILENCAYINGSPQNTLVPGILELAEKHGVMVVGDDLKTGQTKLKSVLVDYLVGAGLKPESIVSYNHLGNNDGKNLSAPQTFRSKEITKRGVVDDMIQSNDFLYPEGTSGPDHLVVIKYVPYVGDSKRAMDEYVSTIAMGGQNTLIVHNTCEDSLLASPIMLDLVIFMELLQRMRFRVGGQVEVKYPIGAFLGYWLKAPLASHTNSLFRQRAIVENIIRAGVGLPINNHLNIKIDESLKVNNNGVNSKVNLKAKNIEAMDTTIPVVPNQRSSAPVRPISDY